MSRISKRQQRQIDELRSLWNEHYAGPINEEDAATIAYFIRLTQDDLRRNFGMTRSDLARIRAEHDHTPAPAYVMTKDGGQYLLPGETPPPERKGDTHQTRI